VNDRIIGRTPCQQIRDPGDEIAESSRELLREMSERMEDATLLGIARDLAEGTTGAQNALRRALDYVAQHRAATHDEEAVKRALSLADGALGAEGREVTDPTARLLARLVAEGRMTGDEAMLFKTAMSDAEPTDQSD
jgi:hypothetical protein